MAENNGFTMPPVFNTDRSAGKSLVLPACIYINFPTVELTWEQLSTDSFLIHFMIC
jgi:hypothetical protein